MLLWIECTQSLLNSSSFLPQVERDMVLWNNKAFKTKPLLAGTKSDELLVKFRRWYSQFYSTEPPEKVKPADLTWWWWWFHTLPQFLPSAISSNCMIRVFCRQLFSKARSGCFVCMWKPLEFNLFYMIFLIHLDILKILFLIMLWKWFIHNTHVHGILNVSSGWLSV